MATKLTKVSIIIPVIRQHLLSDLILAIHDNAGIPINDYEIVSEYDKDRIGAPKMVKKLTDKTKYNLVMFVGDDCVPQKDFVKNALEAMNSLPDQWGIVGLNDMQRPLGEAPTHWLGHKKMLEYCGEFFHTGYIHQYCDNELFLWASTLGHYKMAKNAKILHNHIGFKDNDKDFIQNIDEGDDEDYKRVYDYDVKEQDRILFRKRYYGIITKIASLTYKEKISKTVINSNIISSTGVYKPQKYRILLGNVSMNLLGGSETWMYTLAIELKRLGHEITVYSTELGFMAMQMEIAGIKCIDKLSGEYDFSICAHNSITKSIKNKFKDLPIITVVHGILHRNIKGDMLPEHPITEFKVDQYIAVSEEVQSKLLKEYNIESKIVRNFFDLDRFKYIEKELSDKPKTIALNNNHWGKNSPLYTVIDEVVKHYNAKFIGIGINFTPVLKTEDLLRQADVIFGLGRSVLEGVAMGKLGIVFGNWGTGGVLTKKSYEDIKTTNFSGRIKDKRNLLAASKDIIYQIDKAWNIKTIKDMYSIIEKKHNVKVAAKKLLTIAKNIIEPSSLDKA